MTMINDPVMEIPCTGCGKPIRITGGQIVLCCGLLTRLELSIKTEPEAEWLDRVFAIHDAMRDLEETP